MTQLAVVKTRRMVAEEIRAAVGAQEWESGLLRKLSVRALRRLARRVVPEFSATYVVDEP